MISAATPFRLAKMSCVLGLLVSAHAALAYIDPPVLTPSAPAAGQLVSVSIRAGFCDGLIEWKGFPQVTRTGNNIRLVFYAQYVDFIDFCVFDDITYPFPIGTFGPGTYSVQVDRFYIDDLKGPTTETLGTLPFDVSGSVDAVALPSSSFVSLTLLGLGLIVVVAASMTPGGVFRPGFQRRTSATRR